MPNTFEHVTNAFTDYEGILTIMDKKKNWSRALDGMVELADKAIKTEKDKPRKPTRALNKTLTDSLKKRLLNAKSPEEEKRIKAKLDYISQNQ